MEERIIFTVSSKPCLFDTTADSYRDINTKHAAWGQVSTIVGLPGQFSSELVLDVASELAS